MTEETSNPPSSDTSSLAIREEDTDPITRDNLGRFIAGSSGNPEGRRKGSKNRTTLMKQAIEEMVVSELLDEAAEIFKVALKKARGGENDMIKFTLGEILKEVRRDPDELSDSKGGPRTVNVTINEYFGDTADPPRTLAGEFTEISEERNE